MRPKVYYRTSAKDLHATIDLGVRRIMVLDKDLELLGIDPSRLGAVGMGINGDDWDVLTVGNVGVRHYNQTSTSEYDPVAVYPIWRFEDGYTKLADMCLHAPGKNTSYSAARSAEGRMKRFETSKQSHKIFIEDAPDLTTSSGRVYYQTLTRLARAHPGVGFILGKAWTFRIIFSGTFSDSGLDVLDLSRRRAQIILPNGKTIRPVEAHDWEMWIREVGFTVREVRDGMKGRVAYNLASIKWAEKNYMRLTKFRLSQHERHYEMFALSDTDYEREAGQRVPIRTRRGLPINNTSALPGDGLVCSTCSFMNTCKFFREGSVCAVPRSDGEKLAKLMGSRDANKIIDALSGITEIQARRLGKDLEDEEVHNERSYDTDKRLKDLFDSGQKLARLVDPTLNGKGTTVNVGVGITQGPGGPIQVTSNQVVVADAVRQLESAGFSRSQITPKLIENVINGASNAEIEKSAQAEANEVIDAELVE